MNCFFEDCRTNYKYLRSGSRIVTFELPTDQNKRNKWCKRLGIDVSLISDNRDVRICSLHFDESDIHREYEQEGTDWKMIPTVRVDAVPMSVEFLENETKLSDQMLSNHESPDDELIFLSRETSTPEKTSDEKNVTDNVKRKKQTPNEALAELVQMIAQHDHKAGRQMFAFGKYETALKCWTSAARLKHAGACFNIGICYEKGYGVTKNLKIARCYYRRASKLGHKSAMHNLGVFYANGYGGLQKNRKLALKLFKRAQKFDLENMDLNCT